MSRKPKAEPKLSPSAFTVLVVGPAGPERDECVTSIRAAGLSTVAADTARVREYVKDLIAQGVAK